MTQLYRMREGGGPCMPVTRDEARHWNTPEKGYGIFVTVNTFRDGVRRQDHLARINAWPVDIDDGSKAEQAGKLLAAPLIPSLIVETKRGYQAYWCAKGARANHWNQIVLERLVPHFGADKNARDLCRILRAPGSLHLKDPADPFECRIVHQLLVSYTERQMCEAFEWVPNRSNVPPEPASVPRHATSRPVSSGDDFWERVYQLDCEEGLRRLSGSAWVGGEQYTFRRCSNGNLNILVDGKGSSCFIDESKRIGSLDGGGPTLYQWLRWFGNSPGDCARAIKDVFPQLDDRRAA